VQKVISEKVIFLLFSPLVRKIGNASASPLMRYFAKDVRFAFREAFPLPAYLARDRHRDDFALYRISSLVRSSSPSQFSSGRKERVPSTMQLRAAWRLRSPRRKNPRHTRTLIKFYWEKERERKRERERERKVLIIE